MNEPESSRPRMFEGAELPRLLFLLAIAVAGWAVVWNYLRSTEAPEVEPLLATDQAPPKVPTDTSPEFETVTDKSPLGFRDNAAYAKLLERARTTPPAALAAEARRDVFFQHLWEHPAKHRGVPVHLLGSARRIMRYESRLSRTGWLYEAWVYTPDMHRPLPYVCIFEDAPPGLPVGMHVSERMVFNGYFLKLLRYEASDATRAAPLLVGRIGWSAPEPSRWTSRLGSTTWLVAGLVVMFAFSLYRWLSYFRRSFQRPPLSRSLAARPVEEIAPEALADWVDSVARPSSPPRILDAPPEPPPPPPPGEPPEAFRPLDTA